MHISINILHEYYTPISTKRQANLGKIAFFVDYDHFYVNIIMSTKVTMMHHIFIILNYFRTFGVEAQRVPLNIVFARKPAFDSIWVS